jgi:hypothetical protein
MRWHLSSRIVVFDLLESVASDAFAISSDLHGATTRAYGGSKGVIISLVA